MGGPFGFGAPNEMDIGFEDREEVDGGSAEGMMSSRGDVCQILSQSVDSHSPFQC